MKPLPEALHRELGDLAKITGKCPRCSLCKFPPLAMVESHAYSSICPSYREFCFHSHSGGGRAIMSMSLLDGRSDITDAARDIIFQCTLCGGCDTACKFSSDIEVREVLYILRKESFERKGPLPAHAAMLERMDRQGHPQIENRPAGEWLRGLPVRKGGGTREYCLLVGSAYAHTPSLRPTLAALVELLNRASVSFAVIGDEPDTGRAALEIGDRARFNACAAAVADAVAGTGAKKILCPDAEVYGVLRAHYPKTIDMSGIEIVHAAELLSRLVQKGRLKPLPARPVRVLYHDPCNLGRNSEPYAHWDGTIRKIMGQLVMYDPPRPVNRGTGGRYEPPRQLLASIPGVSLGEFQRRREYSFCCGGTQPTREAFPEFTEGAARHRIDEAVSAGAEMVVTACPNCERNLAAAAAGSGIAVRNIIDVVADSCRGGAI